MKTYIIPIFIPHLGCPNDCVFCNQRAISGNKNPVTKQEVQDIIEKYLGYFDSKKDKYIEVAFFGGSFTGIELDLQNKYLSLVQKYIEEGKIQSIRLSTRPDYITKDILDNLKSYNVKTIELGIQSLDEEVLKVCKRGHSVQSVIEASNLINSYAFTLGHQVMIGLPGSSLEKEIETVKLSISLKPKIVRLYPTLVIKDTELETMYNTKEYNPLTLEEAVERTKVLYKLYKQADIKVIRTGLHVTEDLASESSYVAGPMHSAFGQMVKSSIIFDNLLKKVKNKKLDAIQVIANDKTLNEIVGVKKRNEKILKDKYRIKLYNKLDKNYKDGDYNIIYLKTGVKK